MIDFEYWHGLGSVAQEPSDTYEVMQFTGLHDKNGIEIYEGDIVVKAGRPQPGIVVYEAPEFILKKGKMSVGLETGPLEVIGNIYQHAELLK